MNSDEPEQERIGGPRAKGQHTAVAVGERGKSISSAGGAAPNFGITPQSRGLLNPKLRQHLHDLRKVGRTAPRGLGKVECQNGEPSLQKIL